MKNVFIAIQSWSTAAFTAFVLFFPPAFLGLQPLFSQTLPGEEEGPTAEGDSSETRKVDSSLPLFAEKSDVWQVQASDVDEIIAEDIVDVGQLLPGVSFLDFGSLGQASPMSARGASPQDAAISLNGMILREPLNGIPSSAVFPIDLIQNVSFRGADSFSDYGSDAVGGTFAIQTFFPEQAQPYSRVQFRTGDWGYSDIGLSLGLPITKALRVMFTGSRQEFDGFFGQKRNDVDSRFFNTVVYQPKASFELRLMTLLNRNEAEAPAPIIPDLVPNLFNPRRKEIRFDQQISGKIRGLFGPDSQVQARAFFSRDRRRSFADTLLFDTKSKSLGSGLEIRFQPTFGSFAFGGEWRIDKLDSDQLRDDSDILAHTFARAQLNLGKSLVLGGQVRLEKHSDFSANFNPSLRLSLNANSKTLWLGWRQANRYPTFAERFWQSIFFVGNPALLEESSTAVEVGFATEIVQDLELKATAFFNQVDDWIGNRKGQTSFGPDNFDERNTGGIDLRLNWKYGSNIKLGLVGSYLFVQDSKPETKLQVPEYAVNTFLQIGRPMFQESFYLKLRANARILGDRYGWFYPNGAVLPSVRARDPEAVFDAKISLLFSNTTVSFSWENIFDRSSLVGTTLRDVYELVPGFTMPPRTFRFGVDWQFMN